ncbi:MAG: hypothetical protein JO288_02940 [Hyphomicrobiales bacterium]|nr:hypothetical protein [Hyphomicrobiales bacterium]
MPAERFRIDYALSLVNAFAPGGHEKGFARIERRDVVEGLKQRVVDPSKQDQSAASLCGPAAFLYCVLEEHPEIYTQYVIDLYKTGEGRLGKLHVKPSAGCRAYLPPPDKIHPVDWIAMASLRDSENTLLDYSSANDTAAGITMPHSLAAWFHKLGWAGVRNNTNIVFLKGRDEVNQCVRNFTAEHRICLFINMQMLDPLKFAHRSWTPNHWVVLTKQMNVQKDTISFGVYSWGQLLNIPQTGAYPLGGFYHNFYGYVSAIPTYGYGAKEQ